jgi:hypothetical protein
MKSLEEDPEKKKKHDEMMKENHEKIKKEHRKKYLLRNFIKEIMKGKQTKILGCLHHCIGSSVFYRFLSGDCSLYTMHKPVKVFSPLAHSIGVYGESAVMRFLEYSHSGKNILTKITFRHPHMPFISGSPDMLIETQSSTKKNINHQKRLLIEVKSSLSKEVANSKFDNNNYENLLQIWMAMDCAMVDSAYLYIVHIIEPVYSDISREADGRPIIVRKGTCAILGEIQIEKSSNFLNDKITKRVIDNYMKCILLYPSIKDIKEESVENIKLTMFSLYNENLNKISEPNQISTKEKKESYKIDEICKEVIDDYTNSKKKKNNDEDEKEDSINKNNFEVHKNRDAEIEKYLNDKEHLKLNIDGQNKYVHDIMGFDIDDTNMKTRKILFHDELRDRILRQIDQRINRRKEKQKRSIIELNNLIKRNQKKKEVYIENEIAQMKNMDKSNSEYNEKSEDSDDSKYIN